MGKTTIQSLIDTNLADTSNIEATEHREVEHALLNEMYGTVVSDTQATTNVLTANTPASRLYDVKIVKQGRKVTITGFIKNTSGSMLNNARFFSINAGEYTKDANDIVCYGTKRSNALAIRLTLEGQELWLRALIGNNDTVDFELTYFTNL